MESNSILLVALGGPSSSGKTTVSKCLHSLIPNSTLYHLDDFYLTDSLIPIDEQTGFQNWDCPESIDFDKFKLFLRKLKSNSPVEITSIQPQDTDLKLTNEEKEQVLLKPIEKLEKRRVVFIEGFMLFHDEELMKLFDISLFFHASFETLKNRRESRKGYNTNEGFWVDPPNYFEKIVWPAYDASHSYLFDDGVNSSVKSEIKTEYKLHDFDNDSNTSLSQLINWSLDVILENI